MKQVNRREMLAGGAALAASAYLGEQARGGDVAAGQLPSGAVIILAQLKAKEGQQKAVREALVEMVAPTRREQGCLCYNLHVSEKDSAQFMFYEQWASGEALKTHGQSEHMKRMQEKIKGRLDKGSGTRFKMLA